MQDYAYIYFVCVFLKKENKQKYLYLPGNSRIHTKIIKSLSGLGVKGGVGPG